MQMLYNVLKLNVFRKSVINIVEIERPVYCQWVSGLGIIL